MMHTKTYKNFTDEVDSLKGCFECFDVISRESMNIIFGNMSEEDQVLIVWLCNR